MFAIFCDLSCWKSPLGAIKNWQGIPTWICEYFKLPFLLHSLATKILSNQLLYYCAITQLPTILSLSMKFVPSIMNILKRLADPGQEPATAPKRQREMKLQPKSTRNSSSYSKVTSLGSFSITTLEIGPEYSNLVAQ